MCEQHTRKKNLRKGLKAMAVAGVIQEAVRAGVEVVELIVAVIVSQRRSSGDLRRC